mmetsp:Transcript_157009/g.277160  ORF Transcript_157009/g.277160 Transcript_157009/m.277160 type:complete len:632 (+) Transcript_157009:109-2004(+)
MAHAPPPLGGLSPALDAAMRAQFENQAAFHAGAQQAAQDSLAAQYALPPGLPGLPPGPPGLPTGLPPALQADLQKLGAATAQAGTTESTFMALFQAQQQQNAAAQLGQPPPTAPPALGLPGGLPPGARNPADAAAAAASAVLQQNQQRQAEEAAKVARLQENAAKQKAERDKKLKEQAAQREEAEKKKCHLHKKPNKKCKFCQRYEAFVNTQKTSAEGSGGKKELAAGLLIDDMMEQRGPLEVVNSKTFGFSPLLQTHIVESAHLKALLTLENFDQLVDEMYQFADNIEPYMANSSTTPSALFCCLYRVFTMGIDARQLRRLIDNQDNPYVRAVGFLFIRFGMSPEQLWPWLGEYVLDDEELRPAKDSEWRTTIGEFCEGLLSQEKYYSTVLPRLPMSTKRQLEAKLAPIVQYRKRTKANLDLLEIYRMENIRVEANTNGDWLVGTTVELIDDAPSRLKVRVRLEDDTEEVVHLGKVILTDRRYAGYSGSGKSRNRSRSRSRDKTDWARDKGRPDRELVDELRSRDREKAVCSSGKEYARKPVGYKAACALPREQGQASYRLMEEETFVPMKQVRRRSPSPSQREQEFRKAPSAEHQARMQQLFEKYGMAKNSESSSSRQDYDSPDVLRFG